MVSRCEHCGQTVMATDTQCWHCWRQLATRPGQADKRPQSETAVSNAIITLPSFRVVLLYAGLTAAALLIFIAATRAIGQAPLFLVNSNSLPQPGWRPFTDSQQRFTLNLPEAWHVIEMDRAPEAPVLRSSPPLQALDAIFSALVTDTQLLFLGTEDTAVFDEGMPVFVFVAHSQRLQQLSPDQLAAYAQQQLPENATLVSTEIAKTAAPAPVTTLLFNIEQDEQLWRCLEHFIPGSEGVYLVNACTSFEQFALHRTDFEAILHSFQPLGS